MTTLVVRGGCELEGSPSVPGDKSISHRALMLGAVAGGTTRITGLGPGEDVRSTAGCLAALGSDVTLTGERAQISGEGIGAWSAPAEALDCGNSGTTMRLLAGLVARCPFRTVLDGDTSLRRRPMERIAQPLRTLGAQVTTRNEGLPPLEIVGGRLSGTEITTPVASGQVKSCVLLAALGADGPTSVIEPQQSRDHTERMLAALGGHLERRTFPDGSVRVEIEPFEITPFELDVPRDPSSAAFLVAAAVLGGRVRLSGVGLNPTRIGFLEAVRRMGGRVTWKDEQERMGEPVGGITVERGDIRGIMVEPATVPGVLDELPLLAVLATQAHGSTTVTGAEELRVKESDRISTSVTALRQLGAHITELPDGYEVSGPTKLVGAEVDACGDHRIAMALAVAGLIAEGETHVHGFEASTVSWPGFEQTLSELGADVEVVDG